MTGTPIANHIRRLRFERGEISQDRLARAVGITRQTVVALEAGRYAPSLELAMRLAVALRTPLEALFFWRDGAPELPLD